MKPRGIGVSAVVVFFTLGGMAHFVFSSAETGIIPPYVPYPHAVNMLVGLLELAGAALLLLARWRRAGGVGLVALTIAVTPANVFVLQHAAQFPDIPYWALLMRIPLQVLLIVLIGWSADIINRRHP